MTNPKQFQGRIYKVVIGLPPKLAFAFWMQALPRFRSEHAYRAWVLEQSAEGSHPMSRIADRVVSQVWPAMIHRGWGEIEGAATAARQEAYLLYLLWEHLNEHVAAEASACDRELDVLGAKVVESIRRLRVRCALQKVFSFQDPRIPYPLAQEEARSVEAAVRDCVVTWEELEFFAAPWVGEHFIRGGKVRIPGHVRSLAGTYRSSGSGRPEEDRKVKELVMPLFQDEAIFKDFIAGKDCRFGVADVRDREWCEVHSKVFEAAVELVESGAAKAATTVSLPSVPMRLFQNAPLVDGVWIDQWVVEQAEWGGLLKQRGLEAVEYEVHPLAWFRVVTGGSDAGGRKDADPEQVKATRQEARQRLEGFKGRTKEINGRPYLHFDDYFSWKRRGSNGNPDPEQSKTQGFLAASWNEWVEAHGGEGQTELAGVRVGKIAKFKAGETGYSVLEDLTKAAEAQEARKRMFVALQEWTQGGSMRGDAERLRTEFWGILFDRFHLFDQSLDEAECADLRQQAEVLTGRVYEIKEVIDRINGRFFDGNLVLWDDPGALLDLRLLTIKVFASGHDLMARPLMGPVPDMAKAEDVRQRIEPNVDQTVDRLVTRAKAEALIRVEKYKEAKDLLKSHLRPAAK